MTQNSWLKWLVGALIAVAIAVWAGTDRSTAPSSGAAAVGRESKTKLALLTSLPLVFSEQFGLDASPSPFLAELRTTYDVETIAVADARALAPFDMLLMAHPRAQPADVLVDLDRWVRAGGRMVLLADPKLDWHSERSLGDKLRPPPDFADTGLLAHWGLTLGDPKVDGPMHRSIEGLDVLGSSMGTLVATRDNCFTVADGFVARCKIGKGRVTVIADADFLNVAGPDALDGDTDQNVDVVSRELARLVR